MKKMLLLLLLGVVLIGFAGGCRDTTTPTATPTAPISTTAAPTTTPTGEISPTPSVSPKVQTEQSSKLLFTIKTDKGVMKGELYPQIAPNTVLNFVTLAKKGFYNGLIFHRVVPGFVIQGGDPEGTGRGGPGYSIPAEFSRRDIARHELGTLAMARSQHPDSAGSQFYIMIGTGQAENLDEKYTIFGKVTEGMPVALSIQPGDKIQSIEITGELPPDLKGKEVKKSGVR